MAGKKKRGGKGSRRAPTVVTRWSRRFGRPLPDWPRLSSRRPSGRPQRGDSAWDKTLDHLLSLVDRTLNIGGSRPVLKRALSGGTGGQRRARPVEAARPAVLGDRRRGCSSMVEQQPSKLNTRVRFPSPAPMFSCHLHFSIRTSALLLIRTNVRLSFAWRAASWCRWRSASWCA